MKKRERKRAARLGKICLSLINCPKSGRSIQSEWEMILETKTISREIPYFQCRIFGQICTMNSIFHFILAIDSSQCSWSNMTSNFLEERENYDGGAMQDEHTGSAGPQKSRKTA